MLSPNPVNFDSPQRTSRPTLMTCSIRLVKCANPFNETLHPSLLENTHQRRSQSLSSVRGYFGNCCFWSSSLLDITACDLPELEVSCDIGGNEDISQLSAGHEKFRYEVDVPVIDTSILLPWFLPLVVVSVLLEELADVKVSFENT